MTDSGYERDVTTTKAFKMIKLTAPNLQRRIFVMMDQPAVGGGFDK
jgi:hypothetical protein